MNLLAAVAAAQVVAMVLAIVMERRLTAGFPAAPSTKRQRVQAWTLLMCAYLGFMLFTAAMFHVEWAYKLHLLVGMMVASLLYLPLSISAMDPEDDSPVPLAAHVKATMAVAVLFGSLAAIAVSALLHTR